MFFHSLGNFIIPTDSYFQSGGSTTNQLKLDNMTHFDGYFKGQPVIQPGMHPPPWWSTMIQSWCGIPFRLISGRTVGFVVIVSGFWILSIVR